MALELSCGFLTDWIYPLVCSWTGTYCSSENALSDWIEKSKALEIQLDNRTAPLREVSDHFPSRHTFRLTKFDIAVCHIFFIFFYLKWACAQVYLILGF